MNGKSPPPRAGCTYHLLSEFFQPFHFFIDRNLGIPRHFLHSTYQYQTPVCIFICLLLVFFPPQGYLVVAVEHL